MTRPAAYAPCYEGRKGPGGAVVQTLFAQPSVPYSETSPATLLVKCDKSLCGTGAIQGLTVNYSLSGNGALVAADAVPGQEHHGRPGSALRRLRAEQRGTARATPSSTC